MPNQPRTGFGQIGLGKTIRIELHLTAAKTTRSNRGDAVDVFLLLLLAVLLFFFNLFATAVRWAVLVAVVIGFIWLAWKLLTEKSR